MRFVREGATVRAIAKLFVQVQDEPRGLFPRLLFLEFFLF
jgi:hypothetical protein